MDMVSCLRTMVASTLAVLRISYGIRDGDSDVIQRGLLREEHGFDLYINQQRRFAVRK